MLAIVQLGCQVFGIIAYASELIWWLLGWGLWTVFAVWMPVSFIGIAIGTVLR